MARQKGKAAKKKPRKGDRTRDDDGVQKPGKLMLNNPLIPAHMDEDIDDDLAFDSDDEALYGHFFSKAQDDLSSKPAKKKQGKGAKAFQRDGDGDGDLPEGQFAAIAKAERRSKKRSRGGKGGDDDDDDDEDAALYNYHEDGQSSGDDNEDEYIDLSDMFDLSMKEQGQQKGAKRKSQKVAKDSTAPPLGEEEMDPVYDGTEPTTRVIKKRRGAKPLEESESLYGMAAAGVDGEASSYGSALRTFVKGTRGETQEEAAVRQRLRGALVNKHNLLSIDADDSTKDRATRREVRNVVESNLERYKPLLRELNTAKHVQLPMKAPDSTPVPTSIGGIVSAAEARLVDGQGSGTRARGKADTTGDAGTAGRLASRMHDLLSRAGLARGQLQGEGSAATAGASATTETIGDYVKFDQDEGEDGEGGGDGADGAPTRGYVAKLKALLAYENSRRKRFNRIKSKTYRRILRKEKDREKERREKAFELLHPELARKRLAEKLLKARAEERVTQKHKNTSAWVKHAKRFADFDVNAKDAINEQHSLHQRLMQKMEQDAGEDHYERYLADGGDSDSAASSEEERVVDELFAAAAANGKGREVDPSRTKAATSLLWRSVEEEEQGHQQDDDGSGGRSNALHKARAELGQMKFMKAAREREEKDYADQMEALQADIRRSQLGQELSGVGSDDESDAGDDARGTGKKTRKSPGASAVGRLSFPSAKRGHGEEGVDKVETIQLRKQQGLRGGGGHQGGGSTPEAEHERAPNADEEMWDSEEEHENGVLAPTTSETKQSPTQMPRTSNDDDGNPKQGNGGSTTGNSARPRRSAAVEDGEFAGLRKTIQAKARHSSTRVVVKPEGHTAADGAVRSVGSARSGVVVARSRAEAATSAVTQDPTPDHDLRMHQEYLISRAFAHDDVDEEFLKDKEAQVEAIMKPDDRNENLPGWGEWGGEDAKLNQRHQEKLAHTGLQKQIERSFLMKSRADAALDHVIINHDGVELVPDRMTLHMVPRPFSNPQEFSRSMRQPLGPEWSSALGFKEGVQPRVEVQQGHSVLPLDISLRGKKRSTTKRRKTDLRHA